MMTHLIVVLAVLSHVIVSGLRLSMKADLIIGLNKYSHDASCCIIDSSSGKILFSQAKERISRKKHDGGAVGELVDYGLESIGATLDDVSLVVSNNHHYRVNPFEKRVPLYSSLKYSPADYAFPSNLIPNAKHLELSHHLAHAWSVVGTSPFTEGLILVMDGMGESYKAMAEDIAGIEENSGDYMHDLKLLRAQGAEGFVGQPVSLFPGSGYREAESAYVFDGANLRPVFKRWSRERSPPELYNHGFENMESMGAVYSRISSHLLGDWNACGKVMGLAPWAGKHRNDAPDWYFNKKGNKGKAAARDVSKLGLGDDFYHIQSFMAGNPYDGSFKINWEALEGLERPNSWSESTFGLHANIAQSIQSNLEVCALSLTKSLQEATGQKNLALVGGVALNSVLNGRITKEMGFDKVFVPPGPGDEGVAIGCALYGLHRLREQRQFEEEKISAATGKVINLDSPTTTSSSSTTRSSVQVPFTQTEFPAYQGKEFSDEDIEDALSEYLPWVTYTQHSTQDDLIGSAASKIANGEVVAWFQGKSEFGQRALGARSLLADPRKKELRRFLNEVVKEREWYRPLAPSVLDEYSGQWFEGLKDNGNASPYMSLTATVRAEKTQEVPAVCHIDNTARLQTVAKNDNSLYHALISAFHKLTGVPMVLNTSFNRKSQPIIESPTDALKTLISCGGDISTLYLGNFEVKLREFPFKEVSKKFPGEVATVPLEEEEGIYVQARQFYLYEITASTQSQTQASSDGSSRSEPVRIRIQDGEEDPSKGPWKELPSQLHLEILQLLQDDGSGEGAGEGIVTIELFEALKEVRGVGAEEDVSEPESEEGGEESAEAGGDIAELSWGEVRDAFKWLFREGLVSFERPGEGDDIDPSTLFGGAEIVDLRRTRE